MSLRSHPSKLSDWRDRFSRFASSGQTVVEFCLEEGVSQPSFYQWRKKLGLATPTTITRSKLSSAPAKSSGDRIGFQPVPLSLPQAQASPKVRLPGGIELELGNDPDVIQAVVKQLVESTVPGPGPETC